MYYCSMCSVLCVFTHSIPLIQYYILPLVVLLTYLLYYINYQSHKQ